MAKMPKNTRAGRALRRGRTDMFNPANGEPHTRKFLDLPWRKARRSPGCLTYATAERRAD